MATKRRTVLFLFCLNLSANAFICCINLLINFAKQNMCIPVFICCYTILGMHLQTCSTDSARFHHITGSDVSLAMTVRDVFTLNVISTIL